jgi:hypothetical protein
MYKPINKQFLQYLLRFEKNQIPLHEWTNNRRDTCCSKYSPRQLPEISAYKVVHRYRIAIICLHWWLDGENKISNEKLTFFLTNYLTDSIHKPASEADNRLKAQDNPILYMGPESLLPCH